MVCLELGVTKVGFGYSPLGKIAKKRGIENEQQISWCF